ncbi:hypothetical protein BJ322DRAFT_1023412 [Thelephora terrestris]|uniref:Uncharacterized protein n=1 Tax=Thelephora terrestris TaxID=56493 RepID=A0A9P6H8K2_9AGAM|nr:hypothetical protein BJ322DRAFT_1023412 [Thelephora terrestris]
MTATDSQTVSSTPFPSQTPVQGQSWGEWGQSLGNFYAQKYSNPESAGMTQTNQSWAEWGQGLGKFYAQKYSSPDNVEDLPGTGKTRLPDAPPQNWAEWGKDVGESHSAQYRAPNTMPQFGQQKAQTWGDWGKSVGEYYSAPWAKRS